MTRPPETRIPIPCLMFVLAAVVGLCALGAWLT